MIELWRAAAGGLDNGRRPLGHEAVIQKWGVISRSGGGKTNFAMLALERFASEGFPVIALDPVGNFWSVRLAADGTTPSGLMIPIIGGRRADIPITEHDGRRVARVLVHENLSAVVDVSQLETLAAQRRFSSDFASELFEQKKRAERKRPLMLIIDEAQEFAPQQAKGEVATMLGAFERLIKLGRNFGIGFMMLTQRPQAVAKDVLTQVEVLVMMQTAGAAEREALRKWTSAKDSDETAQLLADLPTLQRGEGIVVSPSWLQVRERVLIPKKATYDASGAPAEIDGLEARPVAKPSTLDLGALRAALAQEEPARVGRGKRRNASPPPQPAHGGSIAEAGEIAPLHRRIAELEGKLADRDGEISGLRKQVGLLRTGFARLLEDGAALLEIGPMADQLEGLRTMPPIDDPSLPVKGRGVTKHRCSGKPDCALCAANRGLDTPPPRTFLLNETHELPRGRKGVSVAQPPFTSGRQAIGAAVDRAHNEAIGAGLGRSARRILEQLVRWAPRPLTRAQVATLAGVSITSSNFGNGLSQLRVGGFIGEGAASPKPYERTLWASEKGLAACPVERVPPVPEDVQSAWMQRLALGPRKMLEVMIAERQLTREELAVKTGISITSSNFSNSLSKLRVLHLVEAEPKSPIVRASPALFMHKEVVL